jgi:hypothetical protein
MKTLIGTFDLLNRLTGKFEDAQLHRGLDARNLRDFEEKWRPLFEEKRRRARPEELLVANLQDAHWDWSRKAALWGSLLAFEAFTVETGEPVESRVEAEAGAGATRTMASGDGTSTSRAGMPKTGTLRRFHGSATLNSTRVSRDADTIATSVVQHLTGLLDAKVKVTIEIEADLPSGVPENVVRTVTENCRTLKFDSRGFEET